jgi:uncharacterized protein YlxW (UPF0749 family)
MRANSKVEVKQNPVKERDPRAVIAELEHNLRERDKHVQQLTKRIEELEKELGPLRRESNQIKRWLEENGITFKRAR